MRILKRILLGLGIVLLALVLFLVGSIAVDALVGGGRVAEITNTTIPGKDGPAIAAYVAQPNGPGPHPAVIMLHEFWGLKPELIGKADDLAQQGYLVVVPDMYRGQTTGWLLRAIYLALTVPEQQVLSDLAPVFDWVTSQPDVQPEQVVVMGFCYGGGKALQFSLVNPKLAGTGIFYGSLESAPAVLKALPGPVLGIFGAEDRAPSPAQVDAFGQGLEAADIPHQLTIYPGVGHAFVTSIEAIRQGGPQGEAWDEFVTWLKNTIPPQA